MCYLIMPGDGQRRRLGLLLLRKRDHRRAECLLHRHDVRGVGDQGRRLSRGSRHVHGLGPGHHPVTHGPLGRSQCAEQAGRARAGTDGLRSGLQ